MLEDILTLVYQRFYSQAMLSLHLYVKIKEMIYSKRTYLLKSEIFTVFKVVLNQNLRLQSMHSIFYYYIYCTESIYN